MNECDNLQPLLKKNKATHFSEEFLKKESLYFSKVNRLIKQQENNFKLLKPKNQNRPTNPIARNFEQGSSIGDKSQLRAKFEGDTLFMPEAGYIDNYCVGKIFCFLVNLNHRTESKKFISCRTFSETCKLFHKISKETLFSFSVPKKSISKELYLDFRIYEHLIQIPDEKFQDNETLINYCSLSKISKKIIPTLDELGFNVNNQNSEGNYLIEEAIASDNLKLVKALINFGANVNLEDACLFISASIKNNIKILKVLKSAGVNINALTDQGENCLHLVVKYNGTIETIKYLTSVGIDHQHISGFGFSPLMQAVAEGRFDTVQHLVSVSTDSKVINKRSVGIRDSSVTLAALFGRCKIFKYLVSKGGDFKIINEEGDNCLTLAAYSGDLKLVQYIVSLGMDLDFVNNNDCNAFMVAVYFGKLEIVKYLLSLIPDFIHERIIGTSYLHVAISRYLQLDNDTVIDNFSTIKYLIKQKGINLKLKNDQNQTAFELAKELGHTNICNLFKEK